MLSNYLEEFRSSRYRSISEGDWRYASCCALLQGDKAWDQYCNLEGKQINNPLAHQYLQASIAAYQCAAALVMSGSAESDYLKKNIKVVRAELKLLLDKEKESNESASKVFGPEDTKAAHCLAWMRAGSPGEPKGFYPVFG
jgi:hypothetical protein